MCSPAPRTMSLREAIFPYNGFYFFLLLRGHVVWMVIENFNPALFGKLNAFRTAAGEHRPSHLRLGLCIDVCSDIIGMCEDSSHPADIWPSEDDPLAVSIGYLN